VKRALVTLAVALLAAGCESKNQPRPDPAFAPSSAPAPMVSTAVAETPPPPLPAASSMAVTPALITDLVAGKGAAERLPEASADSGRHFDVFLRRRLTQGALPGAKLKLTDVKATTGLPPEVVTRIVRQALGRLRACYANGLKRDEELEGTQGFSVVIGKQGEVTAATATGPAFPDKEVTACSLGVLRGVAFPTPEGGPVTATFQIGFAVE
jgi:hypothetical protein